MIETGIQYKNIIGKVIVFLVLLLWYGCKSPLKKEKAVETHAYLRKVYSSGQYSRWPKPELDNSIDRSDFQDIGVLPEVFYPENNPYTEDKAYLGKLLFFDPRLSGSGQIACASCHNPELAWTDNITRSFGHDRQNGRRNAMTIFNVGHAKKLFWDGRAKDLEHQVMFPIPDALEMNQPLPIMTAVISGIEGYRYYFEKAFGDNAVTLERIQKAIATFERSVVSPKSKFDRFIEGNTAIFSDEEVLGLHLFRTKARCINCHNTPYFSDHKFHNDGQTLWGSKDQDMGRYQITSNKEDIGKFKTPTMREVTRTGPWMHHGNFTTLLEVIQFYNLGNPAPISRSTMRTIKDSLYPITSPILKPLGLVEEEIKALQAFIGTLSTPGRRIRVPKLPE